MLKPYNIISFLCISFIYFNNSFCFGQDDYLDSLKNQLVKNIPDTTKVLIYDELVWSLRMTDVEAALKYAESGTKLAKEINFLIGWSNIHHSLGSLWFNHGDYDRSLKHYKFSLHLRIKAANKKAVAVSLGNIGLIHMERGNHPEALKYYFKALSIDEELNNQAGVARHYGNLGLIYWRDKDSANAINYFNKALEMDKRLKNNQGVIRHLGNIGLVYSEYNQLTKAISYFQQALDLCVPGADDKSISINLSGIGFAQMQLGDSLKAKDFCSRALEIDRRLDYKMGITTNLAYLGLISLSQHDYKNAEKFFKEALEVSEYLGALEMVINQHHFLTWVYTKNGKWKEAYTHYRIYSEQKEKLWNDDKSKAFGKMEANYDNEKQNAIDQAIHDAELEKQSALAEAEKKQQQIVIYSVSGGLLFLLIFFILLFNRFRLIRKQKNTIEIQKLEVEKQKEIVDEKNKEILDSITYARRLQEAILPPQKIVKEYLKDSFILYKPKDIVAGDFYFLEPIAGKIIFSAADCTGHGVPGAMVSVVCSNALNRTVKEFGITTASEILNKVRELVTETFSKSESEVKDGMDISLCVLDITTNELLWSGANNPLWIIRNGKNEIEEIRPDKQPIGKYSNPRPFTNHKIKLEKGDSIYIFTDGFADQFGGDKGKKFKAANMKELFISLRDDSMEKHRLAINDCFENWKGELEQVDDVCVIGVRI